MNRRAPKVPAPLLTMALILAGTAALAQTPPADAPAPSTSAPSSAAPGAPAPSTSAPGSAAPGAPAAPEGPPAAAASDEEAIRQFQDGRRLLEEGTFDEALAALRASFERLPSPNTELLIGHALRLTNRRAEAATVYRRVIASAGEKVRAGEERFRPTLEEAGRLDATLRAQLVEIDVVVTGAPEGTTVAIGADVVATSANARGLTAKVLHEPGPLTVVATAPDGRSVTEDLEGQAGGQTSVLLELPPAKADVAPPVIDTSSGGLDIPPPPLASWIAGGVGVAGLAVFGIFGAMSSGAASDLDECSPRCGASLRDTADSGATQQTVANVGLVFGALGLATAGVLWVVWPEDEPARAGLGAPGATSTTAPRAAVRVSPSGRADAFISF